MTDNKFHKLALNESFERVAQVAEERQSFNEQMASAETERLERNLDITNADHIALWLEANVIPHDALRLCLNWLAVQIVEAHEVALPQPTPDAMRLLAEVFADHDKVNSLDWTNRTGAILAILEARGLEIREKSK